MLEGFKGGQLSNFLTRDEIEDIHSTSVRILAEVGLQCQSDRIFKLFEDAGVEVYMKENKKKRLIKIPESLTKEALKNAPSSFPIHARNPEYNIKYEKDKVHFTYGASASPYIMDVENGKYRQPSKEDFAAAVRLGDALQNFHAVGAVGGAFDVHRKVQYEHEWEVLFNNTSKHISYWTPSGYAARKALDMAESIVGGPDELRKNPILSLGGETVSPLIVPKELEGMLEFALAGLPVLSAPIPFGGATAPITMAGNYALCNAESLFILIMVQLVNRGGPFMYFANSFQLPFTAQAQYGPEMIAGGILISGQMAKYYDLPSICIGPLSLSKVPDAQAGAEIMRGVILPTMVGINFIGMSGHLSSGNVASMEAAVMCDEIIGHITALFADAEINEETLAFDVIKEVGPGGNFMTHKHTLKHIRRAFLAKHRDYVFFDASSENKWIKGEGQDAHLRIKSKLKKILKEHEPDSLPKQVQEKISEIVREAENEKIKKNRV